MRGGRIVQIGGPREVYFAPADSFVASFIGRSNLLDGRLDKDVAARQQALVTGPLGPVHCVFAAGAKASQAVAAMIRPEHVELRPAAAVQVQPVPEGSSA